MLMEVVEAKDRISNIADQSTDTEGSSSGKSSCDSGNDLESVRSCRSGGSGRSGRSGRSDKKRIYPKQGIKIFSKV